MGQNKGNPLNIGKNLDGFAKQMGLVIGERVDNRAADTQTGTIASHINSFKLNFDKAESQPQSLSKKQNNQKSGENIA